MGQQNSIPASKYGSIFVLTDKTEYFGGETLNGIVHLYIVENYPGNNIFIKIQGYEKTEWIKQTKLNDLKKLTKAFGKVVKAKNSILSYKIPLHRFQKNFVEKGYYTFPFSFNLPNWIPTSFNMEGDPSGLIRYDISVELEPINKEVQVLLHKKEFLVIETLKEQFKQITKDAIINVQNFWFLKKGLTYIKVQTNQNCYAPDEIVKLQCYIDNTKCRKSIKYLDIQLKKIISLCTLQGEFRYLSKNIKNVTDGYCNAKSQCQFEIELPLTSQNEFSEVVPTVNGNLITCKYICQITPIYNMKQICITQHFIEIPLIIYHQQSKTQQSCVQPPQYAVDTYQMPAQLLVLSDIFKYDESEYSNYTQPENS